VDLDAIRDDLEQVVRESDATLAVIAFEEEEDAAELPDDDADEASAITEGDREEAVADAAVARKAEAEAALARLDAGTYGACIDCGKPIAEARLEFRPEASRCLEDQEKFEETAS
jgi:DnaK suppressor protein